MVWSGLAVVLGTFETPTTLLAAICMIATQLVHAMTFANRAPAVLAVIVTPPLAVLLWLAGFAIDGSIQEHWMSLGAATIMVGYIAIATRLSAVQAAGAEKDRSQAIADSEAKSSYLAFMSHELRTPLTGVLGMTEALRLQPESEDRDEKFDVIIRTSRSMLELLNGLLDIAKIEAGSLDLEMLPVNIVEKIKSVRSLWEETARRKNLAIHCHVNINPSVGIIGDPLRLRQILNNLIGNALKFTERGSVDIYAWITQSQAGEASHLNLEVRDTGIGIAPDVCAALFKPFRQADPSVARRFGGSGLGLSICRQLVEQMGGRISVESVLGSGSAFHVRIPVQTCTLVQPSAVDLTTYPNDNAEVSVLLVDDNGANRQVGQTLLSAAGFVVTLAGDGLEALATLETLRPDIVLMDLNMPRMSGAETLRAIRRRKAVYDHIPCIALTADATPETRRTCLADGFDDVATKPIELEKLVTTIFATLERRELAADDKVEVLHGREF